MLRPATSEAARPVRPWVPVAMAEVDLDGDPADLDAACAAAPCEVLVRLHGRVLDVVPLSAGADRELVHERCGAAADMHVARWGCTTDAGGRRPHPCETARAAALAAAPRATVVIATHDRPALLQRCIGSVLGQSHPPQQVVVVDNAPTDDTTRRLLAARSDWTDVVRYVREEAPGLGRAHNAALPYVLGEVVAITDDDVVVGRDWLAAVLEAFVAHDAECVTGPILPLELRTREQAWVEQYGGFARGYSERVVSLADPPPGDPLFPFTPGRLGSGANMAFRASFLRELGGFDPALGAGTPARGGDDLEAFTRVLLRGGTLVYTPDAVVRHPHHAEYDALRRMAHGYGVGLGAYVTSLAVGRPGAVPAIARRVPAALRYLLTPGSPKNAGIRTDYPRALVRAERLGMLKGPLAYAGSRLDVRRTAQRMQVAP